MEAYEKEREHMKSVVEEQDAQLRRIREEYAAKKKGMFAVCRYGSVCCLQIGWSVCNLHVCGSIVCGCDVCV